MLPKNVDKLIGGVAAVLLLLSLWIFGFGGGSGDEGAVVMPVRKYEALGMDAPAVKIDFWKAPRAQTSGKEWVYDVFTPPEIYYDARTQKFTVTPPRVGAEEVVELPFPLELASVKQDNFPLQLVGYVGSGEKGRGTFEIVETGQTFVAGAGRKVADLGLTIVDFEIRNERIEREGSMVLRETVAYAKVRNEAGETVELTSRERLVKGPPTAMLRVVATGEMVPLKEGEKAERDDVVYEVKRIGTGEVEVEVIGADGKVEKKALTVSAEGVPVRFETNPVNSLETKNQP